MIKSMKMKRKLLLTLKYIFVIPMAITFIMPFYWLIRSSLMSMKQIFVQPPEWIPNPFQFSNYVNAMTILPFDRYFLNTSFIVIMCLIGTLVTSTMAAYGFSRFNWKYRDFVFGCVLSSMMLPFAVTLVPMFVAWSELKLAGTYLPLIVPSFFGGGAFNIFLLRQFFFSIPKELDEAGKIDGASSWQVLVLILVPCVKPALISVGLFTFLNVWNDFMGPLVYISDEKKYTLSLGLRLFQGNYNAEWDLMMAAASIVTLPAVVVFLIGQKYFVEGITTSGLKA